MSDSDVVKERLVRDLVNYQIESKEVGGGEDVSMDEVDSWEEDYREETIEQLKSLWEGTVGEWVNSMDRWYNDDQYYQSVENEDGEMEEIPVWEANGFENPSDWQLQKLVETGSIDYGYMSYRYDHPY